MRLHRTARDNYVLAISSLPSVAGTWQASFDDGATWVDGTSVSGGFSWLVYGPEFDGSDVGLTPGGTLVPYTLLPLLRIKDDPALPVKEAPERIVVWD